MTYPTINRLALSATIVAATLSVSGVALGGGLRPDDRAGVRGIGAAPVTSSAAVRPDDRGGLRGVDPAIVAAIGTHQQPGVSAPQTSALETVNGFDWVAAAAGAGSAVGLIALITAAAFAIRRSYRSAQANT
jgi:hypothetical protein